mgnify:CR=1 FL=1
MLVRIIVDWPQWARTPQHTGATPAVGQTPASQLASVIFDPFTNREMAETGGALTVHYQTPLIDENKVFMEFKTGRYISCRPPGSGKPYPCGPNAWDSQIWNERAFAWRGGNLAKQWNFQSDWKPEPNGGGYAGLIGWEPVFHAALNDGFVFVPGFAGSIYKLRESDGAVIAHYTPFGSDPSTFVSGPLTVDRTGNVYYNALALDPKNPWISDVRGAWLVKVTPQGEVTKVSYAALVPGAPSICGLKAPCGSQRPGINVAPAVSVDGQTIYTVSRAHFFSNYAYLVAVNANMKPKWQTSLRAVAPNVTGWVVDQSSSTPAVAPDGSVFYGAFGGDNSRGYLLKISSSGQYIANYNFGWDETPAIYAHDGTYSVIIKDNHYARNGPYYITQLSSDLVIEWQFKNTTIGPRHPNGYEWCVNAPAVDSDGTIYGNSEDGHVYAINQGGTLRGSLFLRLAVGAAYTPIAVSGDGKIYTENDGGMFVVGE